MIAVEYEKPKGWLFFLIICLMFIGPILSFFVTLGAVSEIKRRAYLFDMPLNSFVEVSWLIWFFTSLAYFLVGLKLSRERHQDTVLFAKKALIFIPVLSISAGWLNTYTSVEYFSLGHYIGNLMGVTLIGGLWVLYLSKSKQVASLYNLGDSKIESEYSNKEPSIKIVEPEEHITVKRDRAESIQRGLEISEKWPLIVEYDKSVQEAFRLLSEYPVEIQERFIKSIISRDPSERNARVLATHLIAEYESRNIISSVPSINKALEDVSAELGEDARAEFIRIHTVVGDNLDILAVKNNLRAKFSLINEDAEFVARRDEPWKKNREYSDVNIFEPHNLIHAVFILLIIMFMVALLS